MLKRLNIVEHIDNIIVMDVVNNIEIACLIDTGTPIPAWYGDSATFKLMFPNSALTNLKFMLLTSNGYFRVESVYKIPKVVLFGITYKNLYIICNTDKRSGCNLGLSANMFTDMSLTICQKEKEHFVELNYDNDVYYTKAKYTGNILHKVNLFRALSGGI